MRLAALSVALTGLQLVGAQQASAQLIGPIADLDELRQQIKAARDVARQAAAQTTADAWTQYLSWVSRPEAGVAVERYSTSTVRTEFAEAIRLSQKVVRKNSSADVTGASLNPTVNLAVLRAHQLRMDATDALGREDSAATALADHARLEAILLGELQSLNAANYLKGSDIEVARRRLLENRRELVQLLDRVSENHVQFRQERQQLEKREDWREQPDDSRPNERQNSAQREQSGQ